MDMSGFEWFITGMSIVITAVNIYLWYDIRQTEKRMKRIAHSLTHHD